MDWYVCVTEIHWVLVKVSPIVAKDCNNRGDKLNKEEECISSLPALLRRPCHWSVAESERHVLAPTMNKDAALY